MGADSASSSSSSSSGGGGGGGGGGGARQATPAAAAQGKSGDTSGSFLASAGMARLNGRAETGHVCYLAQPSHKGGVLTPMAVTSAGVAPPNRQRGGSPPGGGSCPHRN